jgi:PKD repeat protein
VTVTDTSTDGPTAWSWDFGDGSPLVSGQSPGAHTYTTVGTFTISLTASNAVGPSTASRTITTTAPPAPTAAFTASPSSGPAPLAVTVTDTSTDGPTAWSWDFGDGSPPVSGQSPGAHTYTTVGTFTISLTASNAVGPSTASRTITTTAPPAPTAAFTASPSSGPAPLAVTVTDTSTDGPTAWSWDFGDGSPPVSGQSPGAHTYTTVGTFTISLTASNAVGPSTASRTITTTAPPPPPPPPIGGRIKDITFDPTLLDPIHGVDRISGTVTRETVSPLAGPGSARISNTAAYVEETFSATDDVFVTFQLRMTALPSGSPRLFMLTNAGTTQANLRLTSTGRLQLRVGTAIVGADSIALNTSTTYIVGVHQRRGTGGNAVVEAFVAPAGTPFGAPFAARTNGTWTTAADRVRIGGTNAKVSVILDNVLIDSSSLPLTPLP